MTTCPLCEEASGQERIVCEPCDLAAGDLRTAVRALRRRYNLRILPAYAFFILWLVGGSLGADALRSGAGDAWIYVSGVSLVAFLAAGVAAHRAGRDFKTARVLLRDLERAAAAVFTPRAITRRERQRAQASQ